MAKQIMVLMLLVTVFMACAVADDSGVTLRAPDEKSDQNSAVGADAVPETLAGTVITSRSLSYDQDSNLAVFEDDVLVNDPQMKIKTDRLTVFFSESNTVQRLQAEGRVQIAMRELTASGGNAEYDVADGKIVLSSNPMVRRARDMLTGEKITFWRDTNRVLCEPNARLVLYSEGESLTQGLTGKE